MQKVSLFIRTIVVRINDYEYHDVVPGVPYFSLIIQTLHDKDGYACSAWMKKCQLEIR